MRSGTENGFKGWIFLGGQTHPSSTLGASLLWKKAQKKPKKKQTSDTINKTIPRRMTFWTYELWYPIKVASRITSRHHCAALTTIIRRPNSKQYEVWRWNHDTSPTVKARAPVAAVIGHGLEETRWKGDRVIYIF